MSTDLIDAVAGIEPGSTLDAARHARPVAREQIQAADTALFGPGTASLPHRDRLLVAGFATGVTDPSGRLFARRLIDLGADGDLVAGLVASAAQQGPWGSYREPGLVAEGDPRDPWQVAPAQRAALGERLSVVLEHAHLLLLHPRDARPAALARLTDAGWTRPDIVTWSQLISFVAFQTRLASGLAVLTQEA